MPPTPTPENTPSQSVPVKSTQAVLHEVPAQVNESVNPWQVRFQEITGDATELNGEEGAFLETRAAYISKIPNVGSNRELVEVLSSLELVMKRNAFLVRDIFLDAPDQVRSQLLSVVKAFITDEDMLTDKDALDRIMTTLATSSSSTLADAIDLAVATEESEMLQEPTSGADTSGSAVIDTRTGTVLTATEAAGMRKDNLS